MTEVKPKRSATKCKHLAAQLVGRGMGDRGMLYWCPTCGAIRRGSGGKWGDGGRQWTLPAVSR